MIPTNIVNATNSHTHTQKHSQTTFPYSLLGKKQSSVKRKDFFNQNPLLFSVSLRTDPLMRMNVQNNAFVLILFQEYGKKIELGMFSGSSICASSTILFANPANTFDCCLIKHLQTQRDSYVANNCWVIGTAWPSGTWPNWYVSCTSQCLIL